LPNGAGTGLTIAWNGSDSVRLLSFPITKPLVPLLSTIVSLLSLDDGGSRPKQTFDEREKYTTLLEDVLRSSNVSTMKP